MTDIAKITMQDFEPCLNQGFRVLAESGDAFGLELIEVKPLGVNKVKEGFHQPFSLLFRGPLTPALEQNIVELEHETLG